MSKSNRLSRSVANPWLSQNSILLFLAPLASALMVAMCFPGGRFPWLSAGWLMPVALVPLFGALESLPTSTPSTSRVRSAREPRITPFGRARKAALIVWFFGTILNSIAFFWTTEPAILFGGIPKVPAYAGFALYCALAAAFYPIVFFPFLWNAGRLAKKQARPFGLVWMALASTALEHWTPRFFFWTFGSLTHHSDALNQWASVGGFSFLSFFIFFGAAWLARSALSQPRSPGRVGVALAGVAGLWTALYGLGRWRIDVLDAELAVAPRTKVAWVQPNFTFAELSSNPSRTADDREQSLDDLMAVTGEAVKNAESRGLAPLDLIVWPESVAPSDFVWSKPQIERAQAFTAEHKTSILAQAIEFDEAEVKEKGLRGATTYSISFLVRPDGSQSSRFRKWVPIPFGESVPLENQFPWLGELLRAHVGNTSKVGIGTSYEALAYTPEFRVAPLICFDAILPRLPRLQAKEGGASLFVNQANFVWMGRSNAGSEFRELARYRAIENGRSMILAANTGPSVAFDPLGRAVTKTTPLLKRSVDMASLPVVTWRTPYSYVGDIPLALLGALSGVMLVIHAGRKERPLH
jgi:apolipoprotein N-acyltransferase